MCGVGGGFSFANHLAVRGKDVGVGVGGFDAVDEFLTSQMRGLSVTTPIATH